ncbi:hypothetical protein QBC43DRAFT_337825 [Cladorrhinum sp. PSN259]|nr:hypothetical protein QBC43DRAFT_337825 [Cladorrhinum sp. PSN259]
MKLSVALSLGLAALPELASASFASTCRNWYWITPNFLVAECKKANQVDWLRTRQDMNLCIGRSNDAIVSQNVGNAFVSSTKVCAYNSLTGTVLTALCNYPNPLGFYASSLDLDTFVHNNNGYLQCHGHLGAPY